jgi:hypothetical protein
VVLARACHVLRNIGAGAEALNIAIDMQKPEDYGTQQAETPHRS